MQEGQNVQISQGIAKRHKDGSSAAQNGLFKQGGGGGGGGGGTKSSLHLLHPLDKPPPCPGSQSRRRCRSSSCSASSAAVTRVPASQSPSEQ